MNLRPGAIAVFNPEDMTAFLVQEGSHCNFFTYLGLMLLWLIYYTLLNYLHLQDQLLYQI